MSRRVKDLCNDIREQMGVVPVRVTDTNEEMLAETLFFVWRELQATIKRLEG